MKYKALVLSFLLLLPLLGTSAYFVRADWPTPPPGVPILFVDVNGTGVHGYTQHWSSDLKVWGPCVVSSNFNVDVKLWNDNASTGVDVYAFDFDLTWNANTSAYPNNPYISLIGIATHIPAGWFTVFASTLYEAREYFHYHLAATAMPPAEGLIHAINQSLVTLTFHIDDEPCYPDHFTTPFHLQTVALSADGGEVVEIEDFELDDGSYWIECKKPDIHLTSPDEIFDNSTQYWLDGVYVVTERAIGVVHTIKVMLSNIGHAYGFFVRLEWSGLYKKTDLQKVKVGPDWILANYAYEQVVVGSGYLEITVIRPKPPVKPLICSKMSEAFEVDLTVISPDYKHIPTKANSTISITKAWILALPVEWPAAYQYNYPTIVGVPPVNPLEPNAYQFADYIYYSCDMVNYWNPKRPDITLDGHVNIADLTILLKFYGKGIADSEWFKLADPVGSLTVVDIYDFVYIAKNFGDC